MNVITIDDDWRLPVPSALIPSIRDPPLHWNNSLSLQHVQKARYKVEGANCRVSKGLLRGHVLALSFISNSVMVHVANIIITLQNHKWPLLKLKSRGRYSENLHSWKESLRSLQRAVISAWILTMTVLRDWPSQQIRCTQQLACTQRLVVCNCHSDFNFFVPAAKPRKSMDHKSPIFW